MKKILFHTAVAALLCSLAACSPHSLDQQMNGKVKFSAKAVATSAEVLAAKRTVCADFTLQPVSINAAGNQTPAGNPVLISSTGTSQTDAILGCIDAQDAAISPNWGYQVTATHFVDCTTHLAIPGLSPSVAFTNATVQCTAGKDMPLDIVANVSIATPNAAGYIDISVNVNETDVQVGCKDADFVKGTSMLHFGESYIDPKGGIPLGLIGLDKGNPQQWAGTVLAGAAPALDTYYTGAIDSSHTAFVYQTFVSAPACAPGAEYTDTHHAQCLTNIHGLTAETSASLADSFIQSANGFVVASISADQTTISIYSEYVSSPILLGDASIPKPQFNAATQVAQVNTVTYPRLPGIGDVFTGIFVDPSKLDTFAVTGLIIGVPSAAQLSVDPATGKWSVSDWYALSTATSAQIACHGLFASSSGCVTPKPCVQTDRQCGPEQLALASDSLKNLTAAFQTLCPAVDPNTEVNLMVGTTDPLKFCLSRKDTICAPRYTAYLQHQMSCGTAKSLNAACSLLTEGAFTDCICQ